jgi:hypothetical protein
MADRAASGPLEFIALIGNPWETGVHPRRPADHPPIGFYPASGRRTSPRLSRRLRVTRWAVRSSRCTGRRRSRRSPGPGRTSPPPRPGRVGGHRHRGPLRRVGGVAPPGRRAGRRTGRGARGPRTLVDTGGSGVRRADAAKLLRRRRRVSGYGVSSTQAWPWKFRAADTRNAKKGGGTSSANTIDFRCVYMSRVSVQHSRPYPLCL